MTQGLPDEFLQLIQRVTSRRPRIVIEHILAHGYVTTEELKERYGYNHPPRAARDVREQGIPLETFKVVASDGRKIAAYRFGDLTQARADTLTGRKAFSKAFKRQLIEKYGALCAIHLEQLEERYLQVDHRVPYEVAGDPKSDRQLEDSMLLCGSANRAKSWSCERYTNWLEDKVEEICRTCYWAYPDAYTHVAMRPIRRLELTWAGKEEVQIFAQLQQIAHQAQESVPDYVKRLIARQLGGQD